MFKIVKDSIGIKKLLIYMKFNPIKRFLTIWFFMVGILFDVSAQNITIEWKINPLIKRDAELQTHQVLTPFQCLNCFEKLSQDNNYLIPYYTFTIPGDNIDVSNIRLANVEFDKVSTQILHPYLTEKFEIKKIISFDRGQRLINIKVTPIKKIQNATAYIKSFDIEYDILGISKPVKNQKNKKDQTYNSVLKSGDFHKLSVTSDGVHKINYSFLQSNNIDPNTIILSNFKIYGNGGEMLPELIISERSEDLIENPIFIQDNNNNNSFDQDDYILWFAKSPTTIKYNESNQSYFAEGHDFDVASYYFMNWGNSSGKRISKIPDGQGLSYTKQVTQYEDLIYHESNEENHQKSGRVWWGDKMQNSTQKVFEYTIPGSIVGDNLAVQTVTTARSISGFQNSMQIGLNDVALSTIPFSSISGNYDDKYASDPITTVIQKEITNNQIKLSFDYNKSWNEAAAWIDYFVITIPRTLKYYGSQKIIRTKRSQLDNNTRFQISNFEQNQSIWNITDHLSPALQELEIQGNDAYFTAENISPSSQPNYILFNKSDVPNPSYVEKLTNQNLHGIKDIDYLIVTHENLLDQANRLADYHRGNDLEVEVVTANQIYNEFSSGSQDVTAIRDFAKLLYDRGKLPEASRTFKYLLLFGDASYDYKDIEPNNTNIVPIYQSYESNYPPISYCSDDYYAILDDNEGYWGTSSKDESLDIGVGRLPASNNYEAKIIVDKIIHYNSAESRGNWMQTLTFLADDEDQNRHLQPSENMTQFIQQQSPEYNIKKIWMDAYEQVSFGSGNKYPKVNEDINKIISSQGTLIFNYVGHGGENGMAHERVVTRPEISNWTNYNKLSFYITASCELAKIDNLEIESPGELMLLNPRGGAVGMIATTRVVYIGANTDLNSYLLNNNLLKKNNGQLPSLGEAYRETRNADPSEEINKRCFILLGDPAMSLLSPDHYAVTTRINNTEVGLFNDTLGALELVTMEGEIRDLNNQLISDFNGELFPTFYDKPSSYNTLGQDPQSYPIPFVEQNRIIYKGKVSVTNGKFSFQFVVPKDIAYNIGNGKLSYYARDGIKHAGGTELNYKIGGTSDNIVDDNAFDELDLYIDDESWVFGGLTSTKPLLIAHLMDSNGINTIGSGIGREMEAILDQGTDNEQSIILNDYYQPELNSYQKGTIEYPFENLSAGRHTLKLKVWDVYNNSKESYTEFIVSENEAVSIENLLNYPNPFSTYTEFHFDHNKPGQNITANLTVTSVSGKIVKSITQTIPNSQTHCSDLTWDGKDDYGDKLARGVYLYTMKLKAEDGSEISKNQKLYIIN
jgi:hypothetical protein